MTPEQEALQWDIYYQRRLERAHKHKEKIPAALRAMLALSDFDDDELDLALEHLSNR